MNVVLIGFRCAGKTSVGKALAKRLSREFLDCDDYIEKKTNLTIREIFDIAGESYFRMLEGDAISDVSKLDGRVIATGGGAVLKYKNIQGLKRNGITIFLEADVDCVFERIQSDPMTPTRRPSLTGKDMFTEIQEQISHRRPYYLSAADYVVRTDTRPIDEVVREIVEALEKHGILETPQDDKDDKDDMDEMIA